MMTYDYLRVNYGHFWLFDVIPSDWDYWSVSVDFEKNIIDIGKPKISISGHLY